MRTTFSFTRRVAYYETDAMGVMHHSNHVRLFEEARVAWLRNREMMSFHAPYGPYVFAVTEMDSRFYKPVGFDDEIRVDVQCRLEGARIQFQYAVTDVAKKRLIASGRTVLVPVDSVMKPARLPQEFRDAFASEPWDESWPRA